MSNSLHVVVLPIIIGCIAISVINVVKRKVMKDGLISPLQGLILYFGSSTVVFAMVYVFLWGFTLPETLPGMWTAVFCGTAANVLIQFFSVKAASIDQGEVSLTAPLSAMTPGLITVMALLLGEYPSTVGVIGIGLMAVGSYVLLWEKTPRHWYDYLGPVKRLALLFKLGRLSPEERGKTIVVALALGSACFGTIGLLFDALYTRRSLSMQGLMLASMGLTALLCATYTLWYWIKPDSQVSRQFYLHLTKVTVLLPILVMGILWVIHTATITPAFNQTFVAYVGTLKRFSILMSVVLGFLFFKETDFKQRFWAALLIVAGAGFIATDNLPTRLAIKIEGVGL